MTIDDYRTKRLDILNPLASFLIDKMMVRACNNKSS
jgi:hypothetical protein